MVGPLPEMSRGNKYLITCTCYFSKWPEAAPLKSKSAEGTVVSDIIITVFTCVQVDLLEPKNRSKKSPSTYTWVKN